MEEILITLIKLFVLSFTIIITISFFQTPPQKSQTTLEKSPKNMKTHTHTKEARRYFKLEMHGIFLGYSFPLQNINYINSLGFQTQTKPEALHSA